ncbi:MAG TPA: MFS transporter [Bacteroidia bacterium]|nr:MFS transporter [Bacteroidia bacterium]
MSEQEELNHTGQAAEPGSVKKDKFSSYQVFVIIIMALLQFTVVLDFMILSPLGDILMKSMGMSTSQFGSVVSAYAISAGVSGILAAGFADKFDRKKLLLFFYTGFVIGTLFCGLADTYSSLFTARIVTGVFGGVIGAIGMAIVTDLFSIRQRGRVLGFIQMAFAGSQILGVPLGLWLADTFSWQASFFMIVGLALCIGIAVLLKLQPLREHLKIQSDKKPLLHLLHTVQKKNYRIGFMATAILSMGGFMIMPFTSAFLVNNVKIAQSSLPYVFMFTGFSSIIIMPIIGKLSDRISKLVLFTIGTMIASVMILVYTNLGPAPIWAVIIINMILFMGIMSRMVPAVALNSAVPEAADRGAYMSINSSLQQMAGGLAAIVAGFIVKQEGKSAPLQHFDVLGYIMLGFMLWCLYLVYRVNKVVQAKS